MTIDHIFIFTDDHGQVAEQLIEFGFTEGSSRIHTGQGTSNRKFYFDNFFLEIIWKHNEDEINSDLTKPTGLWQRANFRANDFSPFGLCLVNSEETDQLFNAAFKYKPSYLPDSMAIDVLSNEDQPSLPWTFRLPFKGQMNQHGEPTIHENEIQRLTKARFEYRGNGENQFLSNFENDANIEFISSSRNWLKLTFDNGRQGKNRDFESLQLTIEF